MSVMRITSAELRRHAEALQLAHGCQGLARLPRARLPELLAAVLAPQLSGIPLVLPAEEPPPFGRADVQTDLLACVRALLPDPIIGFEERSPAAHVPSLTCGDEPIDWREWIDRDLVCFRSPPAQGCVPPESGAQPPHRGGDDAHRGYAILNAWAQLAWVWRAYLAEERETRARRDQLLATLAEAEAHRARCRAELAQATLAVGDAASMVDHARRRRRIEELQARAQQAEMTETRIAEALARCRCRLQAPEWAPSLSILLSTMIQLLPDDAAGSSLRQRLEEAYRSLQLGPTDRPGGSPREVAGLPPWDRQRWVIETRSLNRHGFRVVEDASAPLVASPPHRRRFSRRAIAWAGILAAGGLGSLHVARDLDPAQPATPHAPRPQFVPRGGSENSDPPPAAGAAPTHLPISPGEFRADPDIWVASARVHGEATPPDPWEFISLRLQCTPDASGRLKTLSPSFSRVQPSDLALPLRRCPVAMLRMIRTDQPAAEHLLVYWLHPHLAPYLASMFTELSVDLEGVTWPVRFALPKGESTPVVHIPATYREERKRFRVTGTRRTGGSGLVYAAVLDAEGKAGMVQAFDGLEPHR